MGFVLIMFGFLVQWPTLVTLVMFPILVTMYVLLAKREERDALATFGDEYRRYAAGTPAFLPRWNGARHPRASRSRMTMTRLTFLGDTVTGTGSKHRVRLPRVSSQYSCRRRRKAMFAGAQTAAEHQRYRCFSSMD